MALDLFHVATVLIVDVLTVEGLRFFCRSIIAALLAVLVGAVEYLFGIDSAAALAVLVLAGAALVVLRRFDIAAALVVHVVTDPVRPDHSLIALAGMRMVAVAGGYALSACNRVALVRMDVVTGVAFHGFHIPAGCGMLRMMLAEPSAERQRRHGLD